MNTTADLSELEAKLGLRRGEALRCFEWVERFRNANARRPFFHTSQLLDELRRFRVSPSAKLLCAFLVGQATEFVDYTKGYIIGGGLPGVDLG
jgi:hypothetical protein